ncbi:MAG: Tab2/Atab2 family RNA-binding protein [Halothece sp. Uz-M2-17]|nr:Tab2/Atab2 family RNA-binding protein [Halothece sp. Uz-M2-17]
METIWELDFYSRPIRDENNKKLWEVLICESPQQVKTTEGELFRYHKFCSAQNVNSIFLQEALNEAMEKSGTTPKKIRFFRRQMNNMITKACEDLELTALPSRRTYALNKWLQERLEQVYPQQEGYDETAVINASVQYPAENAVILPDAIRGDKGDKWAFVSLEASAFQEMEEWDISFGEGFPLSLFELTPGTKIPGLVIFSPRAMPFAGWMSGIELSQIQLQEGSLPRLVLQTGSSDCWILADITNPDTLKEAQGFAAAKKDAKGVHFLAIQTDPSSESFAGFWLLA